MNTPAPFRAALDRAIGVIDFVEEDEVPTYAHRVGEVLSSVGDLLDHGHARAVVELMEHAQRLMQDAVENVGDDGGYIDGLLDDIEALHLEACRTARLDPEDLAARLWELETGSEYGFAGAVDRYASVLGNAGLAAYRKLAEAAWATVPPLGLGEAAPYDANRATLTHIMEVLAGRTGDVDEQVGVLCRDLSRPQRFVAVAKLYREAGSNDRALACAEQGLDAFGRERAGPELAGLVIDGYQDRGRHDEAMALAVAEFEGGPTFASYLVLKARATRAGQWDGQREPARGALRRAAGPVSRSPASGLRPPWGPPAGRTELVRALLADGEPDRAWQEAVEGGCADQVWLELAAERESQHPDDAIGVYQKAVDRLVPLKDKDAYRRAAALVSRIATVMEAMGREADCTAYIGALRAAHRPKRNFMAALDAVGL
jgi:tetratricopeptide (TPR) repeat protein